MEQELFTKDMSRALRRKINAKFKGRDSSPYKKPYKPEKLFRNLTGRSTKIKRCQQLKVEYPRVSPQKRCRLAESENWC